MPSNRLRCGQPLILGVCCTYRRFSMGTLGPVELLVLLVLISMVGAILVLAGVYVLRESRAPKSHQRD